MSHAFARPHSMNNHNNCEHAQEGLTKLEYFTAAALTGILANHSTTAQFDKVAKNGEDLKKMIGGTARIFAEAALEALK